ncbi:MAG: hypothetical protein WA323_26505 [Candidatus Nitrosopolaris sp.]
MSFQESQRIFGKNNDIMTLQYLPRGSSELGAVEECWRQGKDIIRGLQI